MYSPAGDSNTIKLYIVICHSPTRLFRANGNKQLNKYYTKPDKKSQLSVADQLAIYKGDLGAEFGSTEKQLQLVSDQGGTSDL